MAAKIAIDRDRIAGFCRRWKITELALFGSVLRDDFSPESDVDVLVTFAPEAKIGLFGLVGAEAELKDMFGREVDLVTRAALRNPFRRHNIFSGSEVLYGAAPVEAAQSPRAERPPIRRQDRDTALLWDMLERAKEIVKMTRDATAEQFRSEQILTDAVLRLVGALGRAAGRVSDSLQQEHPDIPWSEMAYLGEHVVRDYNKVDTKRVWALVKGGVPRLTEQLPPLIPPPPPEEPE